VVGGVVTGMVGAVFGTGVTAAASNPALTKCIGVPAGTNGC
jgi:hypothetical protein